MLQVKFKGNRLENSSSSGGISLLRYSGLQLIGFSKLLYSKLLIEMY